MDEHIPFILAVARYFFGSEPAIKPLDAFINEVYRLDFDGKQPDRVIKISRINGFLEEGFWGGYGEILREQAVIRALFAKGFEVPVLEHTQADYPDQTVPFSLMPYYPEKSIGEIFAADPSSVQQFFHRTGVFIARLSSLLYSQLSVGFAPAVVQRSDLQFWQGHYERLVSLGRLTPQLDQVMQQVHALLEKEPIWFGNRDGIQVIADGKELFVTIDWGPAGATWRMADLARRVHLWESNSSEKLDGLGWMTWLLDGYLNGKALEPQEKRELHLWRVYDCLRDAMFMHSIGQVQAALSLIDLAEKIDKGQP